MAEKAPDPAPNPLLRAAKAVGSTSASVLGSILRAIAYGTVGGVVVLLVVFITLLQKRQDLDVWHKVRLSEFKAGSGVDTFAAYQQLEETLFAEVDTEVCDQLAPEDRTKINRYNKGSLCDPGRWERNWNRSFEMPNEGATTAVVLVHGMSDSPYSLRALAEEAHARGAWVVGLRLPGHGTAPAGLVDIRWEDLTAATELAVRHAKSRVTGKVYLVGYSTGGALAVHYALRSVREDSLPRIDGIVLVSPAIGVTRAAAFAVWQGRLGRWLGLDKLAWNDISPEYDPFKYGSFAVNAADVAWRLSGEVQTLLSRCTAEQLSSLPPILGFQSAVDATVVTDAVVDGLFARLPDNGNELVLFDINRHAEVEAVLASDPGPRLEARLAGAPPPFTLVVLTNESRESHDVVLRVRRPRSSSREVIDTGLAWPPAVFSLSHVALPKPYDDPLYGGDPSVASPGVQLGRLAFRGERGVLQVPATSMLRLQWNPFYPWMEEKVLAFMDLDVPETEPEPPAENDPSS